jgi:hypothetical protein
MHLYEVIDFRPKPSRYDHADYVHKIQTKAGAKQIGSDDNTFGKAYKIDSPKRLNQITKAARVGSFQKEPKDITGPDDDGYLSYLKKVQKLEKEGYHNPYFPRIHDLKVWQSGGEFHYRVNMEKLLPFDTEKLMGNKGLIESIWERMFTISIQDAIERWPYLENNPSNKSPGKRIERMFRQAFGNGETSLIKDPELKDALNVINKMADSSGNHFNHDLHDGNFMWRMTGTMPQLVILDPLS